MLRYSIAGQIAGASSTEFGLANMIWAAVVVAKVSFPALCIGAPMYTDGVSNVRGNPGVGTACIQCREYQNLHWRSVLVTRRTMRGGRVAQC